MRETWQLRYLLLANKLIVQLAELGWTQTSEQNGESWHARDPSLTGSNCVAEKKKKKDKEMKLALDLMCFSKYFNFVILQFLSIPSVGMCQVCKCGINQDCNVYFY